jgi:hypothetical protein
MSYMQTEIRAQPYEIERLAQLKFLLMSKAES